MNDKETIKELYIDLCQASIDKNLEKLNNILANNYILTHMTGMNQTKKDYIKSVEKGELKYYEVIHESIDIIINGDKANIIGKTKTLASPFGSTKSWWNLRQDLTAEKTNGKWLITHSKASMY